MGTGAIILAAPAVDDADTVTTTVPGQAAIGLMIGGAALFSAGYFFADALFGPKERLIFEDDYELLYSLDKAYQTEQSYNAALSTPQASDTTTEPTP